METFKERIQKFDALYWDAKDSLDDYNGDDVKYKLEEAFPFLHAMKVKCRSLHSSFQSLSQEFITTHSSELKYRERKCKKLQGKYVENARNILYKFNDLTGNDLMDQEIECYLDSLNLNDQHQSLNFDLPPIKEENLLLEIELDTETSVIDKKLTESPKTLPQQEQGPDQEKGQCLLDVVQDIMVFNRKIPDGAVAEDVHDDDAVLNGEVKAVKGIEDTVPDIIAHDQKEDYPPQTGMCLCSSRGEHPGSAGEDFQASGKQGRPPDVPQEGHQQNTIDVISTQGCEQNMEDEALKDCIQKNLETMQEWQDRLDVPTTTSELFNERHDVSKNSENVQSVKHCIYWLKAKPGRPPEDVTNLKNPYKTRQIKKIKGEYTRPDSRALYFKELVSSIQQIDTKLEVS